MDQSRSQGSGLFARKDVFDVRLRTTNAIQSHTILNYTRNTRTTIRIHVYIGFPFEKKGAQSNLSVLENGGKNLYHKRITLSKCVYPREARCLPPLSKVLPQAGIVD